MSGYHHKLKNFPNNNSVASQRYAFTFREQRSLTDALSLMLGAGTNINNQIVVHILRVWTLEDEDMLLRAQRKLQAGASGVGVEVAVDVPNVVCLSCVSIMTADTECY